MEWLMADWDRNNSRPAAVKLAVRARVANARSCRLSSGDRRHEFSSSFIAKTNVAFIAPEPCSWFALTAHSNFIVRSRDFWDSTQGTPVRTMEMRGVSPEPRTFSVVLHQSAQHFLLREWLHKAGLVPDRDDR
jgi:hypothetical protein